MVERGMLLLLQIFLIYVIVLDLVMIDPTNLIPEKCFSCCRPVRAGQSFILCQNCDRILHKKCKSTDNTKTFRELTYCTNCTEKNDILRYSINHLTLVATMITLTKNPLTTLNHSKPSQTFLRTVNHTP